MANTPAAAAAAHLEAVIDPDGTPLQRVHMLWSAHRIGEEWKIGWRQFLGPSEADQPRSI
jgi:hypothetical protein